MDQLQQQALRLNGLDKAIVIPNNLQIQLGQAPGQSVAALPQNFGGLLQDVQNNSMNNNLYRNLIAAQKPPQQLLQSSATPQQLASAAAVVSSMLNLQNLQQLALNPVHLTQNPGLGPVFVQNTNAVPGGAAALIASAATNVSQLQAVTQAAQAMASTAAQSAISLKGK